mgnify:CR=1 FL=1
MRVMAHLSMVMNLDLCIGCQTCTVTCKQVWANREGLEYAYFNNVETRPSPSYPYRWEDQEKYRGGWVLERDKLRLRIGGRIPQILRIFSNPYLPTIDDYGEPWTYSYEDLFDGKEQARPMSMISGREIHPRLGPNWFDDLAGGNEALSKDPVLEKLGERIKLEYEKTFMFYLPRICNHCLNPACVAACPSGAIYKRAEDGIVLIDQIKCRGWRYCVSACPYKKIYFNWKTGKSEKCIFCYPRIEASLPTICAETCVGKIRYIGVVLYDRDRVLDAVRARERDLVEAHRDLILDPFDEKVIKAARDDGIPDDWIEAAQRSPVYKLIKKWRIALPLHPEYRTLPMVWYIMPLNPILSITGDDEEITMISLESMRIPLEYLASMFVAGNTDLVKESLEKLILLRRYMRLKSLGKLVSSDPLLRRGLEKYRLTQNDLEDMYNLLAIAKYNDRFVIPKSHREKEVGELLRVGEVGYEFSCTDPEEKIFSRSSKIKDFRLRLRK